MNPNSAQSSSPSTTTNTLLKAISSRRTYYSLTITSPIPDSRLLELTNTITTHTPSSYNSQLTRLFVLLKDEHTRLWDMAFSILRTLIPADRFAPTQLKVLGLRAGYGTVLFYEDSTVVKKLQADYPLYKENFPTWSSQTSAMHQILLWTALESEGLGVNLQHYNPLIDGEIEGG